MDSVRRSSEIGRIGRETHRNGFHGLCSQSFTKRSARFKPMKSCKGVEANCFTPAFVHKTRARCRVCAKKACATRQRKRKELSVTVMNVTALAAMLFPLRCHTTCSNAVSSGQNTTYIARFSFCGMALNHSICTPHPSRFTQQAHSICGEHVSWDLNKSDLTTT